MRIPDEMQYYDKKAVGERIKNITIAAGMTQCLLAEKLDYTSERQLQRIEKGDTSCSVDKLMEQAQILGVSDRRCRMGKVSGGQVGKSDCISGKHYKNSVGEFGAVVI